jgi:excisionase family DNA binding protein
MSEQPATLQGVTVAEAATILGVSTATVRRMLKRGQLEGQRVIRPQGSAFVVMLPGQATDAAEDATSTLQGSGVTPRDNASPGAQLAAWSETFLLPLVAALERSQVTIREQAEELGMTRAERDAARAEVETLRAAQAKQDADLPAGGQIATTDAPEPPGPRLWHLWLVLAVVVLALVTVVVLLAMR